MNIYLTEVTLIVILSAIFRNKNKDRKYVFLSFLILFIIMGFRESSIVGNDSATSYLYGYYTVLKRNVSFKEYNFAFELLMKYMNIIGLDYQWFITIEAFFVCFSFGRLIKKYSVDPSISILWFIGMLFYSFMFSALKQAYAMAFLCYAFDALVERKPIKFIIFVLIASSFHFPALIFLPAYWMVKIETRRNYLIILSIILVLVFIFRAQILEFMTSFYYEEGSQLYSNNAIFMGTKVTLMLVTLIMGSFLRPIDNRSDNLYWYTVMFSGIAIIFQTFCYYNNIFERLADYYYVFSILYMPLVLERKEVKTHLVSNNNIIRIKYYGRIIVIIFCVFRFASYMINDPFLNPYLFFWQY